MLTNIGLHGCNMVNIHIPLTQWFSICGSFAFFPKVARASDKSIHIITFIFCISYMEPLIVAGKVIGSRSPGKNDCLLLHSNCIKCDYDHYRVFGTLASGRFWRFLKKDTETHVALRENFSHLVSVADLVESSKDVASLLVCSLKKILWLGCGFFVSDVISRGRLGHLGLLYLALGANH